MIAKIMIIKLFIIALFHGQCVSFHQDISIKLEGSNSTTTPNRRYVTYKNYYYSTIGDVEPDGYGYYCQNYYASVPSGWTIPSDSTDVRTVIKSHTWSTSYVQVSGGKAYGTSRANAGLVVSASPYLYSSKNYILSDYYGYGQILIRKSVDSSGGSSTAAGIIAAAILIPSIFCIGIGATIYYCCVIAKQAGGAIIHPQQYGGVPAHAGTAVMLPFGDASQVYSQPPQQPQLHVGGGGIPLFGPPGPGYGPGGPVMMADYAHAHPAGQMYGTPDHNQMHYGQQQQQQPMSGPVGGGGGSAIEMLARMNQPPNTYTYNQGPPSYGNNQQYGHPH